MGRDPFQPSDAVHAVALVADQDNCALLPYSTLDGLAVSVITGRPGGTLGGGGVTLLQFTPSPLIHD